MQTYVTSQMRVLCKLFAAELTSVRLLTGVQLHVRHQVAERGAFLAAFPAFGLVTRMLVQVHKKLRFGAARFIAVFGN